MLVALTREVSPQIAKCELTFLARDPIDYARAVRQHDAYCETLRALGVEIIRMPALAGQPDACFVEDTALVFDEIAILTRMGAPSRRAESASVGDALRPFRPVVAIGPPGTIDGGDVLVLGKRVFVGRTTRTDDAGMQSLRSLIETHGYVVTPVDVPGCLHLKSAATVLDGWSVLAQRAWFDAAALGDVEIVDVHPDEMAAANVLKIGPTLVMPRGFPRTRAILETRGHRVVTVDVSEFLKAEAAVTCKSLLFTHPVDGSQAA